MATAHAKAGEIMNVRPPDGAFAESKIAATVLLSTELLQVVRLVVPAGKDIANHTAPGDITVQCLEGAIDFTTGDRVQRLAAGQMLYLALGTLHALHGVENASVLVTVAKLDRGAPHAG